MSKKSKFIEFVEDGLFSKIDVNEVDPDVMSYWEALKGNSDVEKPLFTDNGKLILAYMKTLSSDTGLKSKDIAEALFISSRTVAGAMRKLVNDGFVEKLGDSPISYIITEKGKTVEIN